MGLETLIRFVGERVDPDSGLREGLFQLAFRVSDDHCLPAEEQLVLRENLDWLTSNLDAPRRLSPFKNAIRRGRSRSSRREGIAISWFKSDALEHLERARAVAAVLRRNGYPVEEIKTQRPGYVTHEDVHQVVAVPFRGE